MSRKHPIQNTHISETGILRFRENEIVRYLLEEFKKTGRDLNDLYIMFHDKEEDYEQLMMLIGYSLSGFRDLGYGRTEAAARRKTIDA